MYHPCSQHILGSPCAAKEDEPDTDDEEHQNEAELYVELDYMNEHDADDSGASPENAKNAKGEGLLAGQPTDEQAKKEKVDEAVNAALDDDKPGPSSGSRAVSASHFI